MLFNKQDTNQLFSDFLAISKNEWLELISSNMSPMEFDNFRSGLTKDGVNIKPVYNAEDVENKKIEKDGISFMQSGPSWQFQEIVLLNDGVTSEEVNKQIHKALEASVESLLIDVSGRTKADFNLQQVLRGVHLKAIDISWRFRADQSIPNRQLLSSMHGTLYHFPLESYMSLGTDPTIGMRSIETILNSNELPAYRCLPVSGYLFANSGADIVQELAFTCNLIVEYLDHFTERGFDALSLFQNLEITLSTRTSYLVDIAKYRAIRILLNQLKEAYHVLDEVSIPIRALSAVYNKVSYDIHTNMLRNTTEAMAALLGGCDKLCLLPHNNIWGQDNEFGKRIARNVSHLLRQESHLALVHDPLKGSYALESITSDIARQAWSLFQQIEEKGGLLEAFKSGSLQKTLFQTAEQYLNKIGSLNKTSVGANRYVPRDSPKNHEEFLTIFENKGEASALVTGIRGPAVIESIRKRVDLEVAKGKKRPVLGILIYSAKSKPATVSLRSSFVEDVLMSIGVEVRKLSGSFLTYFKTVPEVPMDVDALALIGDDAEYNSLEPESFQEVRKNYELPILLAGRPENISPYMPSFGIDLLIFSGMDVPTFADKLFGELQFFDV